ncbi:cuticle protein AMP1A-like isoform X2 [Homarus americanus]|uniref:cuticle protein AMP1A-like isoform X2 n=1 Tax=Homarus americanus TaxID=6706 RepID=UPI001C45DE0D|nr:cuticle protein AMP1A-like isoform X2 [Homarus americanus]
MKFVVLALLATVATAAPQYAAPAPAPRYGDSSEEVPIIRHDFVQGDYGGYQLDMETGNGIKVSESGAPGADGAIASSGSYSYTAPDGTPVHVQFVADENGYQPQSDLLPVAPAFPHPIPQFVLDQIAFAAEEDSRKKSAPSRGYGAPQ